MACQSTRYNNLNRIYPMDTNSSMRPEPIDWFLSCIILAISVIIWVGGRYYSDGIMKIKHPHCLLPKITKLTLSTLFMPLATSVTGIVCLLISTRTHRIAGKKCWQAALVITLIFITVMIIGIFMPWVSCKYRSSV